MIPVQVPQNVVRALRKFDPRLRLIWSRSRKRFEVLEALKDGSGHYAHCFYVECEGKALYDLGSGEVVLRELRARDVRRRFETDDQFVFEMTEGANRQQERDQLNFEESMSDDVVKDALGEFQGRSTGPLPKRLPCET